MRKRHEKSSVSHLCNWFRVLAAAARAPIASMTRKPTLHLQQLAHTVALILPSSRVPAATAHDLLHVSSLVVRLVLLLVSCIVLELIAAV
jgi:hypothetical protein